MLDRGGRLDFSIRQPEHQLDAPARAVGFVSGFGIRGTGGKTQPAVNARQAANVRARVERQRRFCFKGAHESPIGRGSRMWSGSKAYFNRSRIRRITGSGEKFNGFPRSLKMMTEPPAPAAA